MGHLQNMQTQDMNLVLSTDAKPRLKWTPELHQRFVNAVNQLGGPEKATPKGLMRAMGIQGLTLYHLKSHLQKYRLGKNHPHSETCNESMPDSTDYNETQSAGMDKLNLFCEGNEINDPTQEQDNENARISEALKLQMEVQRKLHEQIEVQRHLQLRIEAQGKYLQKVLQKAQETLSSYNCSAAGVEHAKAEISQLVSMVSSSSFSGLTTDNIDLSLENIEQKHTIRRHNGCSVESSLTSSESSRGREEKDIRDEQEESNQRGNRENRVLVLPLLDESGTTGLSSRKRSRRVVCERNWVDKTSNNKKSKQELEEEMGHGLRKFGFLETIDLNSKCENDLDFGPRQPIDLNSKD